ncbi:hypothetical protein EB118_14400 [bacterium]|nr:hypothetical protein [bacterium]NDD83178.1 hypothetical protein [bacterium]NDG31247.1 hypothetical protein [bacterium]
MSFFFEGNGYFDGSFVTRSTVGGTVINTSAISGCTVDMLSFVGEYTNIINVKDPIQRQDAATKNYVDTLGIVTTINLSNTNATAIATNKKGSFVITITNLVLNGPSGVFNITKSEGFQQASIVRTSAAPGYSTNVFLNVTWPPNSNILLNKTGAEYDGTYLVKII